MSCSAIFILGAPRSGTTLLRLLLNAHSEICAPDECIFFNNSVFPQGPARWKTTEVPKVVLERFAEHLASRLPQVTQLEVSATIEQVVHKSPKMVFLAVMHLLATKDYKSQWAEKTPGNVFFVDVLLEMFPNARFVVVSRDPRAVVASMNRVPFYSSDTALNAMNLRHFLAGMQRARRLIPTTSRHTVRYEELLERPEQVMTELCSFLGLDYEPRTLEFYKEASRSMDPRAASDFNKRATNPMDSANAERWKQSMQDSERAVLEFLLRKNIKQGGYEPSANYSCSPSERAVAYAKALYWYLNRLRKLRDRTFQQRAIPLYRTRVKLLSLASRLGCPVSIPSRRDFSSKK